MSKDEEIKSIDAKVVVLGVSGVGKTCLVNQYVRGQFLSNPTATIGAAFMKKDVHLNGCTVVLQLWDTAGQERFRSMAPMYYRGAHAAILVFDVCSPDSFDKIESWVAELQSHASQELVMVVAANKADLRGSDPDASVPLKKAQAYAKTINTVCFETSAKTGKGVEELFDYLTKALLKTEAVQRQLQKHDGKPGNGTVNIERNAPDGSGGSTCCGR